jgi:hypothetical protein
MRNAFRGNTLVSPRTRAFGLSDSRLGSLADRGRVEVLTLGSDLRQSEAVPEQTPTRPPGCPPVEMILRQHTNVKIIPSSRQASHSFRETSVPLRSLSARNGCPGHAVTVAARPAFGARFVMEALWVNTEDRRCLPPTA